MGRWDKDGNWAVGSCIAIFFAIGFWMWWSYHWNFGDICPANEQMELALCARSWIGALAGYFATVFGALTILVLLKQIKQSERHREAALQREGRLVADMLLIDLLVTAERLRGLARKIDLDPPIAEISRKMIPDAVKVTPVLAIALQKHCLEVSDFVNHALQNFQLAGQLLSPQIDDRRRIAFRATPRPMLRRRKHSNRSDRRCHRSVHESRRVRGCATRVCGRSAGSGLFGLRVSGHRSRQTLGDRPKIRPIVGYTAKPSSKLNRCTHASEFVWRAVRRVPRASQAATSLPRSGPPRDWVNDTT